MKPSLKGEVSCLSAAQFMEKGNKTRIEYALVGNEVYNSGDIPREMTPLMKGLGDVFANPRFAMYERYSTPNRLCW